MHSGLKIGMAFAVLAAATVIHPATEPAWPDDSIHHIDVHIETADGSRTTLARTAGRVRLVTMFYASCPMACPLIIDTLHSIDRQLPAAERARLRMLLVTLDPERDTPAALRTLTVERRIDASRWTLGRASVAETRELAAALGIQYRRLGDGNFNHSSTLVLLSADGRIIGRSTVGKPDPEFVARLRTLLAHSS